MAKKTKYLRTKFVKEITVIDPDTKGEVQVAIYKLETGGMIGIDSSYVAEDEPIYSPFDKGVLVDVEETY